MLCDSVCKLALILLETGYLFLAALLKESVQLRTKLTMLFGEIL